jgi:hypothetical protein
MAPRLVQAGLAAMNDICIYALATKLYSPKVGQTAVCILYSECTIQGSVL